MRKLIYISHPYGGDEANANKIANIIRELNQKDCTKTYVSPVHTFGFLYDEVSYDDGLKMCIDLLSVCDEMWVFGEFESSRGCKAEITYCNQQGIPVQYWVG